MAYIFQKAGFLPRKYLFLSKRSIMLLVGFFALSLALLSCAVSETPSVHVAAPDTDNINMQPYITHMEPQPGSTGINVDTGITLHIKDDDYGVDKSSIKMMVQGSEVNFVVAGHKMDYKLFYKPTRLFEHGEKVYVEVRAADLASPPLHLTYIYSFETCFNSFPVTENTGDKIVFQNELMEFTVKFHGGKDLVWKVAGLPEGAVFDSSSLVFSWIPEDAGVYNVSFSVNGSEVCSTQNVRIIVEPERALNMNVIFYGHHDTLIQERIIKVQPQYLTSNTAHSLWGEINGYNTAWLIQDVSKYKDAGIKVIGYLTSGYEGMGSGSGMAQKWYTLEMNKKLIKNMAEIDRVDGVFIDECSAFPDDRGKVYLKELTDFAHSFGLIVWGNAGQPLFDPWFFTGGGFDFMHSDEQWHDADLSDVQKNWRSQISVTGYRYDYDLESAVKLTLNAWSKGIAFCYITTRYDILPVWFEEYSRQLRKSGKLP